jgi:nucleoside phosphorylase
MTKLITNIIISSLLMIVILHSPFAMAQSASSDNRQVKKVLLLVAMDSEAQPIISALQLHQMKQKLADLPMRGYVGKFGNIDILLITNGQDPVNHVQNIGTQAETLSTYIGISFFHPDLIINIGTAGGVEENGIELKDIYVSKKIYFYDRRIALKGYQEYGLGGYESASLSSVDKGVGFKTGIVCSGDSFDDNNTDYDMFLKLHCSAVDMEAAGAAWVSMLMNTPMVSIKGITNFVKGADIHDQYQKNLPTVTVELSRKLKELLSHLSQTH